MIALLLMLQSPPDYISLTADAQRLATAVTSAASCKRFGFVVDADGLSAKAQHLIDTAVSEGMPGLSAETIVAGAIHQESDYQKARAASVKSEKDAQPFLNYWLKRCEGLASDATYSRYYSPPEEPE